MRKTTILIALLVALSALSGCSQPKTRVIEKDGEYFLEVNADIPKDDSDGFTVAPYVSFSTVEEMVQTIRSGDFTEEELEILFRMYKYEDKIRLFDLSKTYDVNYPDTHKLEEFRWYGSVYHVGFDGVGNAESDYLTNEAHIRFLEKAEAEETIYDWSHFEFSFYYDDIECEKTIDPQTNKVFYNWEASNKIWMACYYTIQEPDRTVYIFESYYPEKSQEIPENIDIISYQDDQYFRVRIDYNSEVRSEEWYCSWSIEKYKEQI